MATLFTKLPTPVANIIWGSSKCYYYDKEGEYCIFATHGGEPKISPGIYQFNLNENQVKLISKYPSNFSCLGMTIDQQNGTIYLCGDNISQFIAFNLKQKLWKTFSFTSDNHYCPWPELCFVTNLNDVIIHRRSETSYKFNTKSHKLTKIGEIKKIGSPVFSTRVFDANNKLLLIQMNELYFCDYTFQQNTQSSLTIPNTENTPYFKYKYAIAGNILFSFEIDYNMITSVSNNLYIWCLDLIQNKWFKSVHVKDKMVQDIRFCEVIGASDCTLHFVNFINEFGTGVPKHYTLSLHDLIPKEMREFYASYYKPLVMGFFRQNELNTKCVVLPIVLKEITLLYFPFFI
eukprot:372392_1